jgi:DNA-binding NarL/FixJ family response regulator
MLQRHIEAPRDKQGRVVRVLVAAPDPLVRRALRDILHEARFAIDADAADGAEAVDLVLHHRPHAVVMDIDLPRLDGIAATERITSTMQDVHVVLLSNDDDPETGLRALRAGAAGYLAKDIELGSLPRTIRGVLDGEAGISRTLAMYLVERLRTMPTGGQGLRPVRSELTEREWEVLDLLTSGGSTTEIASELVLSPETVLSHIKHILRKLGVHSRRDAVQVAERMRQSGGVPPPGAEF